jgi:hypothetical protein
LLSLPCALQAAAAQAPDELDDFEAETSITVDDVLNDELARRGCVS